MNVIVTGASGFIGSHVVQRLECYDPMLGKAKYSVTKVCGYHPEPRYKRFLSKLSLMSLSGRYAAPVMNTRFISDHGKPDVIVHLGACTDTTCDNWGLLASNNLLYTKALIDLCKDHDIYLIIASSASTYGLVRKGEPCCDTMPLEFLYPTSKYGWSKHLADLYASSVGFHRCASLKFFNVYGPGEGHKEDMASFQFKAVKDAIARLPIAVFDGDYARDFVWVGDVVDVILGCIEHQPTGVFNVGCGSSISFADIAYSIADIYGAEVRKVPFPDRLAEHYYQPYTRADMSKLWTCGALSEAQIDERVVPLGKRWEEAIISIGLSID